MNPSIFDKDLQKNSANYLPLTPITFIERAASVYPDKTAIISGSLKRNWTETYQRCRQMASALNKRGIGKSDTIAALLPNVPEMLELHYVAPMLGSILNAQNIRLDAKTIAFMLDHAEAKVFFVDREFSEIAKQALELCEAKPLVVDVDDPRYTDGEAISSLDYQTLLDEGDRNGYWQWPEDEWQAISLNYTSGTTGNPKGVVYHHRGAYLNALSNILGQSVPKHAVYLWTLPMFHCNGWCFTWSITAVAGTHVCIRYPHPEQVFPAIQDYGVTHFCGAPIVLNSLINADEKLHKMMQHEVNMVVGGAPPPAAIIQKAESIGIKILHSYGLTETYGPALFCDWQEDWAELSLEDKAAKMARQGVRGTSLEELMVADPKTLKPVPRDAETVGEIFVRVHNVMKGYLKNPDATKEAFEQGWFHTGDLAVWHEDRYVQVTDRSKDVIISGGENISTIEVESTLFKHESVLEAAVVAKVDEKWGETPCAFVTLKENTKADEQELIKFCRDNMAHFKCPKHIVFTELPKTATGKIQKFKLRELAEEI